MTDKQKKVFIRIIITVVLLTCWHFIFGRGAVTAARVICYGATYLIIGCDIIKKALHGIAHRKPFDECFLMAVATIGAVLLGDFAEGCAVMLFYQIGELFQSYAVGKSRRNIADLMDIRPDYAHLETEGGETLRVDPDTVAIGSVIEVQPGEKVPIDGVVVEGEGTLDTAALTGESVPRTVREGDDIISGSISLTSLLRIRTTKEFGESTVSRILELTENASSRKSRTEAFISRFARVYTPVVCLLALFLALALPAIRLVLGLGADWSDWIYRALVFLVISCPCALVISIPLSFFAAIGGASHVGVLVKGSSYLEALSEVRYVLFDKTGTLTRGVFEVSEVASVGMDKEKLLMYAAAAESHSTHPIAESIRKACPAGPDPTPVSDVHEYSGEGVEANVGGESVAAGNLRLMKRVGVDCEEAAVTGTTVYVAVGGVYAGHIVISDRVKETSKEAIRLLKDIGVRDTVMLTGDREQAARGVAEALGIDKVYADLLPADKVTKVEEYILREGARDKTAFVGDGINDAPVLSRADVGIAMGALGSDAAIEAADVVLMDDDPVKVALAIRVSSRCMRIVYQNIYFAIGLKLLCLVLGALGIANMWAAIFADVGVMVIAVLNAMRALYVDSL